MTLTISQVHDALTPQFQAHQILDTIRPHLCAYNNIIAIRSPRHTDKHHTILHRFSSTDMLHGPTITDWDTVAYATLLYLLENPTCHLLTIPDNSAHQNQSDHSQTTSSKSCSAIVLAPGITLFSPSSPTPASASPSSAD